MNRLVSGNRLLAVFVVAALLLGACGGDDDDPSDTPAPASDDSGSDGSDDDGSQIEGTVADDLLIVPRDYLQGEWCDSDGSSWTIEGDVALLQDGSDGVGEFPVDILFINSPDVELISQTADEFTFASRVEEVTFTRGGC